MPIFRINRPHHGSTSLNAVPRFLFLLNFKLSFFFSSFLAWSSSKHPWLSCKESIEQIEIQFLEFDAYPPAFIKAAKLFVGKRVRLNVSVPPDPAQPEVHVSRLELGNRLH